MPSNTQKLVKKLDRVFSKYIRKKYSKNGACQCVTCGKWAPIPNMHAGHFVGRQYKGTRWDEKNVHPQCPSCNSFREGMKDEYALFLVTTYGKEILEELNYKKHAIFKLDSLWLEEVIKEYEKKLSP